MSYKKIIGVMCAFVLRASAALAQNMSSPGGRIRVERKGEMFEVTCDGVKVLDLSSEGVLTARHGDAPVYKGMRKVGEVNADYRMLAGKRLSCRNRGKEYACEYAYADGTPMRLVMRVYDDGLAFRYELSGLKDDRLKGELTSYGIGKGTRRWFMEWSEGYEGFYPYATNGEGAGCHWAYPLYCRKEMMFLL